MAASVIQSEPPSNLGDSEVTAQDVEELVRLVERLERFHSGSALRPFAVATLVILCGGILYATSAIVWPTESTTRFVAQLVTVTATSSVCFFLGRRHGWQRATQAEHSELLQLLRQIGPALVQQGRLSELRWATIKIQLSRYGI